MPKIKFLPHNKEVTVDDGEILIRAAMEAGVHVNASCGGEGLCGKCRVIIESGSVEGGITERLSSEDQEKDTGWPARAGLLRIWWCAYRSSLKSMPKF